MKECPSCRKVYSDDLFFCLDDGSPLLVVEGSIDSLAPTEVAVDIGQSARTEFLPHVSGSVDTDPPPPQFTAQEIPTQVVSRPFGVNTVAPTGTSPWLYLVIGVLATALVATGFFIFMSGDKDNRAATENKDSDQTNLTSSTAKTPEKTQTAANVSALPRSIPGPSPGSNGSSILPQLTEESVRSVLNAWVQSQNTRSFSTYQACYDASFVGVKTVKNGHSKTYTYASWMADRRKMIAQAINLSVEMSNLRVRVDGDTSIVEFDQYYRSLRYSDWGPKEIRVKMTPSGAKIVYEILKDSHPL